jgi:hypothetical protein
MFCASMVCVGASRWDRGIILVSPLCQIELVGW